MYFTRNCGRQASPKGQESRLLRYLPSVILGLRLLLANDHKQKKSKIHF
jgi:hypothetical protein